MFERCTKCMPIMLDCLNTAKEMPFLGYIGINEPKSGGHEGAM